MLGARDVPVADITGTSDPYVLATLGEQTQGDRSRKVDRVTDAEFRQVFEFEAWLPGTSRLVMELKTLNPGPKPRVLQA